MYGSGVFTYPENVGVCCLCTQMMRQSQRAMNTTMIHTAKGTIKGQQGIANTNILCSF
jgi:hypothetical protein